MKTSPGILGIIPVVLLMQPLDVRAGEQVTVDNFVRAETDMTFKRYEAAGGFGKFFHLREPTPLDKQDVIRMNRDTLYSIGIFDLTEPVTITKPEVDRWQSMMLVNQDHSVPPAIQDAGSLDVPDWDEESLVMVRDAINVLGSTLSDTSGILGEKDKLNPIYHLIGTALGWGGNPKKDAIYVNVYPEQNDGGVNYAVTVKDIPVNGFSSITVYNNKGFMEPNDFNTNSFNNLTWTPNPNGGVTIHFGGCEDGRSNCIPITKGWNYVVRLYQPQQSILDGSWIFPDPEPVD